jgi:hypothetical protein
MNDERESPMPMILLYLCYGMCSGTAKMLDALIKR